jgi:hAT family C-terminal dimerisation region
MQPARAQNSDVTVTAEAEVSNCLAEPCFSKDTDPLSRWKVNLARFPTLCQTARRSAPPTSVPSERLFNTADDIFTETEVVPMLTTLNG